MENSVIITNDKGQEVVCFNFSELIENLIKINSKLLPSNYSLHIKEDDWEFYDFPLTTKGKNDTKTNK